MSSDDCVYGGVICEGWVSLDCKKVGFSVMYTVVDSRQVKSACSTILKYNYI